MGEVLTGFATIGALILLGVVLADRRVVEATAQHTLSSLALLVATPALMVTTLAGADVRAMVSSSLVVAAASFCTTALLYVIVARLTWHHGLSRTTVGALSSAFVNAGNLGLPIAAYVLGDAALIVPIWLLQLIVVQPVALLLLDVGGPTGRRSVISILRSSLLSPVVIAAGVGLTLSLTGWGLPRGAAEPLLLLGGMAVPSMLIAYGISLRVEGRPGAGRAWAELTTISVLKVVVQPLTAYIVARSLLGLTGTELLAATVLAALPTAHNVFAMATRYRTATAITRDVVLTTTVLAVPAISLITVLLARR